MARCTNPSLWLLLTSVGLAGCFRAAIPADDWLEARCRGQWNEPVRVGALLPLSGKFQWYGQAARRGMQLAAEADGRFALVVRDTAGEPAQAVRQLEELVQTERVAAVIGPVLRGEATSAAVSAQQLGIVLIALSGVEDLTAAGSYVFRNYLSRKALVKRLVGYARGERGLSRFAVIHPEDEYGTTYLALFRAEVERSQGVITRVESYPPDATNLSLTAEKLVGRYDLQARAEFVAKRRAIERRYRNQPLKRERALSSLVERLRPIVDFDAVFVPDVYEKVALFAPALAAEDVGLATARPEVLERMRKALGRSELDLVHLLGTEGWNHPQLVRWAGGHLQGAVFVDGFFAGSTRPVTRRFVDAYRQRYGHEPERLAAYGYDTVEALKHLFTQAPPCSGTELRDALLRLGDFEGAAGLGAFDENGQARHELFLLEVRDGAIVEKAPIGRISANRTLPIHRLSAVELAKRWRRAVGAIDDPLVR